MSETKNSKLFIKRGDRYKEWLEKWGISLSIISKKMNISRQNLHIYLSNNFETDFKDEPFERFIEVIKEIKKDMSELNLN